MMRGGNMVGDDQNMSNLTSTSGELVSASNSATLLYPQHSSNLQLASSTNQQPPPPPKKKRSLPGNPDPDAEVIALSPKTLMATNRFICEICNKGFQRDQNLQLHRRGHNLPWKLKQRAKQEVIRKKVYVCPDPTCVHHEPARALGDLTGIKKHFSRKHGEKKWKCEKCSKRYAVQSDWKAHSKICGTREYRCDCGTLFSRRDSFITHRAFCDALAEESARTIPPLLPSHPHQHQPAAASSLISHMAATTTDLQPQLLHSHSNSQALHSSLSSVKREQNHLFNARLITAADRIPPWLACPPGLGAGPGPPSSSSSPLFVDHHPLAVAHTQNPSQNPSHDSTPSNSLPHPLFQSPTATAASPHMSATALLQKAAQMGVTMSKPASQSVPAATAMQTRPFIGSTTTSASLPTSTAASASASASGLGLSPREELGSGSFQHAAGLASFGNKADEAAAAAAAASPSVLLHDMMISSNLSSSPSVFDGSSSFEQSSFNAAAVLNTKLGNKTTDRSQLSNNEGRSGRGRGRGSSSSSSNINVGGGGNNDGLTRDFLGLKSFPHRDFPNLAEFNPINTSSSAYGQQNRQSDQTPRQG